MNEVPQMKAVETMEKALLTIAETAHLLSLSPAKVYQMCSSGELACIRIGRSVRVPAACLDSFICRHAA